MTVATTQTEDSEVDTKTNGSHSSENGFTQAGVGRAYEKWVSDSFL